MAGGFRVGLDFEGLAKPRAALHRLRELGENILPFMEDARDIMRASVLGRFESGRGPGGIPWAPTKRQRRQAVGPTGPNKARILVDTGDLQSSIRGEATGQYAEVGSDGLKNPVKALANQFGSHKQTVVLAHERIVSTAFGAPLKEVAVQNVRAHGRVTNLPARPFIGIDAQDEADIEEAWEARIIRTFANG